MVELRNIIWEYKSDQKEYKKRAEQFLVPWFILCHYLFDNKYKVQALVVILLLLNYQAVDLLFFDGVELLEMSSAGTGGVKDFELLILICKLLISEFMVIDVSKSIPKVEVWTGKTANT